MGWIRDITQCPRCGYKVAEEEKHLCSWHLNIFCVRCGYSCNRFFNSEKEEALKKGYSGTDEELRAACWDWKVIYPTGSYIYRRKGEGGFTVDSIKDGSIENLIEHLDEYDVITNRQFIMKILKLCLNFTQWCIDNLGKVHIDIKTKNILVQFDQDGGRFDLKFVDLGLMEDAGNHYQPDRDMLREKSYENELYPRKNCNFQQFVLFSLAIMMLDIKGYDIEKLVGRSNDKKIPGIINNRFIRMPTIKAYLKKFITFKFNGIKSAYKRLVIIEKIENLCKN